MCKASTNHRESALESHFTYHIIRNIYRYMFVGIFAILHFLTYDLQVVVLKAVYSIIYFSILIIFRFISGQNNGSFLFKDLFSKEHLTNNNSFSISILNTVYLFFCLQLHIVLPFSFTCVCYEQGLDVAFNTKQSIPVYCILFPNIAT